MTVGDGILFIGCLKVDITLPSGISGPILGF